jgi:Tol biopolymer transport system component
MGTSEATPGGEAGDSRTDRFDSWKEIAVHLGRSVSTVQRWEKQEGLPVHRHLHNKQGTVYAFRSEVDAWWRDRRPRLEPSGEASFWEGRKKAGAIVVVSVIALAVVAGIALRASRQHRPEQEPARPVRATSLQGAELDPALSPDGATLAFVWDGHEGGTADLYVQPVGGGTPHRLTRSGSVCCPAWSPDGGSLAFVRLGDGLGTVVTIPATGGPERGLATLHPWFGLSLAWAFDGSRLVYPDRPRPTEPYALVALTLDTLRTQAVTRPDRGNLGDAFPSWAPDGKTLAFSRVSASGDALPADVYLVREGLPEPRRLTFHDALIGGLDWSADGRDVFFSGVRRGEEPRIWRVFVEGTEEPTPVGGAAPTEVVAETASAVSHDLRLAVSRRSGRIVYVRGSYDTDIWRMANPLREGAGAPERLIASTLPDEAPQFSPDGGTIAFSTSRSGHGEIWTCRRDGSGCAALTRTGVHSGTPRFSPDGRQVVFDSRPEDQSDVFVLDLASRQARRLTGSPADDVVPSWSADGRTVYFASNRTGSWEVWKTDVEDGSSSALTSGGGFAAFESADTVYFTKHASPGLWRMARTGGNATRVADGPQCWGHWAMGPDGVYFLESGAAGRTSLQILRTGAETPVHVGSFVFRAPCAESSLAVSPDGREVLYVATEEAADIMMAELPP